MQSPEVMGEPSVSRVCVCCYAARISRPYLHPAPFSANPTNEAPSYAGRRHPGPVASSEVAVALCTKSSSHCSEPGCPLPAPIPLSAPLGPTPTRWSMPARL
jgi:hypothetical protein